MSHIVNGFRLAHSDTADGAGAVRPGRRSALFLLAVGPLFALYLGTARTDLPYHIDAATNVFTAWTIATTGSPILSDYAELESPEYKAVFAWVVPSQRGPVSQYPPGTALLAVPLYAIWSDAAPVSLSAANADPDDRVTVPIPRLWPAALVAAITTAASLGFVALTVYEASSNRRLALATALVGGLGTGAWTVASQQLWQHGPNMLWVALGVYLAARDRWGWAGLAFAALTLTRPPVVLVGLALGLMLVVQRRFRSAAYLLAGVAPGVAALLAYNAWLFGSPSVSGGYGRVFAERATNGASTVDYLFNIGDAFFSFDHGVFVWSPFVALGVLGLVMGRHQIPPWAAVAAVGGAGYLLLQLRLNRSSGGEGFSYYRYPLETLTASATVLGLGCARVWTRHRPGRILLVAAATFAIAAHLVA